MGDGICSKDGFATQSTVDRDFLSSTDVPWWYVLLSLFDNLMLMALYVPATIRHFDFMLRGLQEVETELSSLDIPFKLLLGAPKDAIPPFMKQMECNLLITDFSPLRISRKWMAELAPILTEMEVHITQVCS